MRFTDPSRAARPARGAARGPAVPAGRAVAAGLLAAGLLAACSAPPPPEPAAAARAPGRVAPPAARERAERPATSMMEVRRRAALRILQMNPQSTFSGPAPHELLAVQVLEIELDADGRVRHIRVLRRSEFGRGTVEIAEHAIERAAPFGDLRHCPRPWSFVETFLFTPDRRFKPRILED